MTNEDDEDFDNSTKCRIRYVKVWDHCHITEKYGGSVHRGCSINVKLNHKIPIVFHNLNNYDLRLIIQELGKFNFKINAIPNGVQKYMCVKVKNSKKRY